MLPHRIFATVWRWTLLLILGMGGLWPQAWAQTNVPANDAHTQRVLLIFSESRDLPGNVLVEQAVRSGLSKSSTNRVDFFTESLDAGRFPNAKHYRLFRDYLKNKYQGQNLDLVMLFMGRDFLLAQELPSALATNLPKVLVAINDLDVPELAIGRSFTGIFHRLDIAGTLHFVFQLQPETRRVVVVGGDSPADRALLQRIGETTRSVDGVTFDYWTNRPLPEIYQAAATLTPDTIILMGTMQRDVTGRPQNTSRVVQNLAPAASVPVYVLGEGSIGSGPIGGHVVDLEQLGADAARLAARVLAGTPASQLSVEIQSNGVPMADWRALQRWHINPRRLPADCIIRYQPHSVWQDHWIAVTCAVTGLLAQAVTIVALLLQRRQHRLAEAEILRQRTELAHVGRVSMMGQLASALTHELNQPLAAILRNAEAAEIYLQRNPPEMKEIQAILTDIRRDDKRAGNVIDRMRSLFKRQSLTLETLDLKALTEDTLAMIRPDAAARHIKLRAKVSTALPPAQGDRVQVQQVLLNLILNGMDAMTAMPQERRSLTIRLSATKNGNLRVSVTDGGTGIAPENAAHVFEPFFTTKANGMGMGLAISKTIIEAHGGEVWVRSSAMEGTTFTFLLPPAGCDKLKPGDLPSTS